jgi:pimeloyl-ACP methyl ester carboxylesterase
VNFRYSDTGSGIPLVFVGGAFQSIDRLGVLSEHWRQRYRNVLIELPGFGQSDYLPSGVGFEFTANCIKHVVDKIGLGSAVFVGTSYGSPSVYRYVSDNQEKVEAMLLGGSCTKIDSYMEYQIRFMIWLLLSERKDMFPEAFKDVMCNVEAQDIPNAQRIHHILIRSLSRLSDDDKKKFVSNSYRLLDVSLPETRIHIPTMVFTGEHDQFTKATRLSEFSEYCWDLRIVRIPQADHMYHLEQAEKTLELIDNFVDSVLSIKNQDMALAS